MVTAWAFAALFLSAGRAGIFSARQRAIRRVGGRPTLIVGAGKVGHLLARRLLQRPEHGLKPVGFLDGDHAKLAFGFRGLIAGDEATVVDLPLDRRIVFERPPQWSVRQRATRCVRDQRVETRPLSDLDVGVRGP